MQGSLEVDGGMCGQWSGELQPVLGPNDIPGDSFLPPSLAQQTGLSEEARGQPPLQPHFPLGPQEGRFLGISAALSLLALGRVSLLA